MNGYDKHIRNARIMLFILAALTLVPLAQLMPFNDSRSWIAAGIVLVFAAIFVFLALWTRKRPYTAIMTALIFFVAMLVLSAFMDPAAILQAWVLKIVVIVLLILGLRNGKEAQNMMDAFERR